MSDNRRKPYICLGKEQIYNSVFKCNSENEQKFDCFSQLTGSGKRLIYLAINLALGGNEPKKTINWLIERNIINGSKSAVRRVQQIIHHKCDICRKDCPTKMKLKTKILLNEDATCCFIFV